MTKYLKQAYAVREQAILPVRYMIEARYASEVQGDLFGAEQSYKAMLVLYPRNASALSALGETQRQIGHHADAAITLSRPLVLVPNYAALYYGVCAEDMKAGLADEAKRACDNGIAHGLDSEIIRLALLKLALLQHDKALYAQQVEWGDEHHSALLLAVEAQGDLLEGRIHDASVHLAKSCELLGSRHEAVCNQYRFGIASELASMGEVDLAKRMIAYRTPDPSDDNGLMALAQVGDIADAEAGLAAQQASHSASPGWNAKVGSIVRAVILLQKHRPAEVAAVLEAAQPFEGSGLDSWYFRAVGYAQSGDAAKAADEFQHLLAAQPIDPVNVGIPLAELGLARALAEEGKAGEATAAYRSLFAMWKDADSDLTILKIAQKEFASLPSVHSQH